MPEYELTLRLNKKDLPKFRKSLSDIIDKEIMPAMFDITKELLLYQPEIENRPSMEFIDFINSHHGQSGLFSLAIIENLNTQHVNMSKSTVRATKIPGKSELTITAELTEKAAKEFADFSPSAILHMVTMLSPFKSKAIFERVVKKVR